MTANQRDVERDRARAARLNCPRCRQGTLQAIANPGPQVRWDWARRYRIPNAPDADYAQCARCRVRYQRISGLLCLLLDHLDDGLALLVTQLEQRAFEVPVL